MLRLVRLALPSVSRSAGALSVPTRLALTQPARCSALSVIVRAPPCASRSLHAWPVQGVRRSLVPQPPASPPPAPAAGAAAPPVDVGPLMVRVASSILDRQFKTWRLEETPRTPVRTVAWYVGWGLFIVVPLMYMLAVTTQDQLPQELQEYVADLLEREQPGLLRTLNQEREQDKLLLEWVLWMRKFSTLGGLRDVPLSYTVYVAELEERISNPHHSLQPTAPFDRSVKKLTRPRQAATGERQPEETRVEFTSLLPFTALGRGEMHVVGRADTTPPAEPARAPTARQLAAQAELEKHRQKLAEVRSGRDMPMEIMKNEEGKYVLSRQSASTAASPSAQVGETRSSPSLSNAAASAPTATTPAATSTTQPDTSVPFFLSGEHHRRHIWKQLKVTHSWKLDQLTLNFPDAQPLPRAFMFDPKKRTFNEVQGEACPKPYPAPEWMKQYSFPECEVATLRAKEIVDSMLPGPIAQGAFCALLVGGALMALRMRPVHSRQLPWSKRLTAAIRDHPTARKALKLRDRGGGVITVRQMESQFVDESIEWNWRLHLEIGPRNLVQMYHLDTPLFHDAWLTVHAEKRVWEFLGQRVRWGKWHVTKCELQPKPHLKEIIEIENVEVPRFVSHGSFLP